MRKVNVAANGKINKIIVHIQDVHSNGEAQENIGRTVRELIIKKQIDLVGLEGAFGSLNLTRFRTFPRQDIIRKVSDYLLREDKISGPVHAALAAPDSTPSFIGIDDPKHYRANVEAYRASAAQIEPYKKRLKGLARDLEDRKARTFNSNLLAFDREVQSYRAGALSLGAYVQLLNHQVGGLSLACDVFLEAFRMESLLNFSLVETERSQLLSALLEKLNKTQAADLLNHSVSYRTGTLRHADFYEYLSHLCEKNGVPLDTYPAMRAYLQYVLVSDRIDPEKLFEEIRLAEERAFTSLAQNRAEKVLVEKSKRLYLVGKLLDFELTAEEWRQYKTASGSHCEIEQMDLTSFEAFYQEAGLRDSAIAKNLLRVMNHTNTSVAVLVTGGFHSDGINKRMSEAGVATITFAPRITKVESEKGTSYLSVFTREHTPLEKLFKGDKLFLASPPAAGVEAELPVVAAALIPGSAHSTLRALAPTSPLRVEEILTAGESHTVIVTNANTGTRGKISVEATAGRIIRVTHQTLKSPIAFLQEAWVRVVSTVVWLHEARHLLAGKLWGKNARKVSLVQVQAQMNTRLRDFAYLLVGPGVDVAIGFSILTGAIGLIYSQQLLRIFGISTGLALMVLMLGASYALFESGIRLSMSDWRRMSRIMNGTVGPYPQVSIAKTDPSGKSRRSGAAVSMKPKLNIAALRKQGRVADPKDDGLWDRLARYLVWYPNKMLAVAGKDKYEVKVGGHPAATTSPTHIMMAVYLFAKRAGDHVADKPHASPTFHSIKYLLGELQVEMMSRLRETAVLNADPDLKFFYDSLPPALRDEFDRVIATLEAGIPDVAKKDLDKHGLAAYPSLHDPDGVTIPTGSVEFGGSTTICLALVLKWLKAHGYIVPESHFFAIVGDASADEGNYLEAIAEAAKYKLGNVTHIIDYNRQSLDGNRGTFEYESLKSKFYGWKIIELRWGRKIQAAFDIPGGSAFQEFIESLNEREIQAIITLEGSKIRDHASAFKGKKSKGMAEFLDRYSNEQLQELVRDMGGHDIVLLTEALAEARESKDRPVVIFAHTIKGWGQPSLIGQDKSHMMEAKEPELEGLRESLGISAEDPFERPKEMDIERKLAEIRARNAEEKKQHDKALEDARKTYALDPSGIPDRIPTASMATNNLLSTQVARNLINNRLQRIALTPAAELKDEDLALKPVADRIIGVFPDVGLATLNGFMGSLFGEPESNRIEPDPSAKFTMATPSLQGRHIEAGIKEMLGVNITFAFGKAQEFFGVKLLPTFVCYAMFIYRRAFDAVHYGQYISARFVMIGTPSGSSLAPEGAQHQDWESGLLSSAMPNVIDWEPAFADELEYIVPYELRHNVANEGLGVDAERLSTVPVERKVSLWGNLSAQKKYAGQEIDAIRPQWIKDVMKGGYKLVDFGDAEEYDPESNVVNIVTAGPMVVEALKASKALRENGIFANVIVVTSVSLLFGKIAANRPDGYAHLKELIPEKERLFTPVVTVVDASRRQLEGFGDSLQLASEVKNLGIDRNGLSTRSPQKIYRHHGISAISIAVEAMYLLHKRDLGERVERILDWALGGPSRPPIAGSWIQNRFYVVWMAGWVEGVVSVGVGALMGQPIYGVFLTGFVFWAPHMLFNPRALKSPAVIGLALFYSLVTFALVGFDVSTVSFVISAAAFGAATIYHVNFNRRTVASSEQLAQVYADAFHGLSEGAVSGEQIEAVLGKLSTDRLVNLNSRGVGLTNLASIPMDAFLEDLTKEIEARQRIGTTVKPKWRDVFTLFWSLSIWQVPPSLNGAHAPNRDALVFAGEFSADILDQIKRLRRQLSPERRVFVIAGSQDYGEALYGQDGIDVLQEGPQIVKNGEVDLINLDYLFRSNTTLKNFYGKKKGKKNAVCLLAPGVTLPMLENEIMTAMTREILEDNPFEWGMLDAWINGLPAIEPIGLLNIIRAATAALQSA